ncbi:MAG: DUF2332 domain-containing protein [Gimesia sp.]|nr:DUF2332 domain-containing protein [Gimesia sp.]
MSVRLAEKFIRFAELECLETSPLYYHLSHAIALDETVLEIASHARAGQPVPNLLFAAVHYLLVADPAHPLADFYATCCAKPSNPADAWPVFKDFVQNWQEELIRLLQTRLVQTNEVRRCAFLFPAFFLATRYFDSRPLALIEIGTSAGLNLLWDKYQYSYGGSETFGDSSSPVLITSELRGNKPAILTEPLPQISHRIGVDLNVIDTKVPEEADWLRALIWPENHERRELLDAAIRQRASLQLDLRTGDGFAMIKTIADEITEESLLCVYHTHVANQISQTVQESFLNSLEQFGQQRDLIHIFNNIKQATLQLNAYRGGQFINVPLANTDGHARWIEWLPHN